MNPLLTAASCLAERIKINSIRREIRDGRVIWLKRRRRSAAVTLSCANHFFRLAGNPVRAIENLGEWQRWEIGCFRRLHGSEREAFVVNERTVAVDEVPGVSLSHHLTRRSLTPSMAAAAGRELRRSHALPCETLRGPWSHGDPHAGNFLHDATEDRARLIDFEVMHDPTLSPEARHADDLLVFLQDVVGRVTADEWIPLAEAFLDAYDRPEIAARLVPRLFVPRGIPRIWWAVRTTYLPGAELARRLALLRDVLAGCVLTTRR